MSDIQVDITDLHDNLDSLINQAEQGHNRVILLKGGKPTVVIIGIEAFNRLEQQPIVVYTVDKCDDVMKSVDALRQRIAQWQKEHGVVAEDSVETLWAIREAHDESIAGMC